MAGRRSGPGRPEDFCDASQAEGLGLVHVPPMLLARRARLARVARDGRTGRGARHARCFGQEHQCQVAAGVEHAVRCEE